MTITPSTIKLMHDYNQWANDRMLMACEPLTMEQWSRDLGHSWGSVHGVLTHMFAAEAIWLARWKGNSPQTLQQPADFPTIGDLRQAWRLHNLELAAFVEALTDDRLQSDLSYTNTRGQPYTQMLGHMMLHLFNHGTHHRGELAAMLAMLDAPHPEDDLIGYVIEKRRKSELPA